MDGSAASTSRAPAAAAPPSSTTATVAAPSASSSTSQQQPTLRSPRSISSVVARPLSLLSTRSLHRREPATDPSTTASTLTPTSAAATLDADASLLLTGLPAGSRLSFSGSTRNLKRDSRGLLAAQVEMNFEEALLRDDTLRLSSTPSTAVAPDGDSTLPDGLRSSLDRRRPPSKAQDAARLAEEDEEELLADMSGSTDSSDLGDLVSRGDSETAEAGHHQPEGSNVEPAEHAAASSPPPTPNPLETGTVVSSPPASSAPLLPDGEQALPASLGPSARRIDRKPPPSSFSPPLPDFLPSSTSHPRLPSPRPSLSLADAPPVATTPPPASPPTRAQPGVIPPSPSVQPPTPTHPPPEFKRRPSSTPSAGSGKSVANGTRESIAGDIPRTGSSLDLATLARDDLIVAQPSASPTLSSGDNSSTKSTTPRAPHASTFMSPPSQDVPPQTPPKTPVLPHSVSTTSAGTRASLARSPSGGVESDLSNDDWEKLGLSPATPSSKALAPESALSQQTTPAARQISYGLGAGIGSTPSASSGGDRDGSHRGDGFRSIKSKARTAFSKMFSSPSARAGGGAEGGGASGMPKKASPRHFGSMSSSNLASYVTSATRRDLASAVTADSAASRSSAFASGSATLPSRSSSHNSLAAARGTPPLPEKDPARTSSALGEPFGRSSPVPVSQPMSASPERRATEPLSGSTTVALDRRAGGRPRQFDGQAPSASSRRRSMSVSDAAGGGEVARSWEHDVEGLLDGIVGSAATSPRRNGGTRNAVSTSSSPSQSTRPFFSSPTGGGEGTMTTTITGGTGKAARSVEGSAQRVVSPPPPAFPTSSADRATDARRPSTSSTQSFSDIRGERRPSVTSTTSSHGTSHPDALRTNSPQRSSPANHSPQSLADAISFRSSGNITPSSSAANFDTGLRRLPAIPASPSGQSFGLSGSPYTIPSPVAKVSSAVRASQATSSSIDLSEDLDDVPSLSGDAHGSPRFRGQTIRLVPASPSPRLPPLPNSSPMATPSKFILRRTSSSDSVSRPPTPTRAATAARPLIETLDSVGLGIVDPVSKEEIVLGSEINLMTTEEEARDAVRRIRAEDDTLKWVSENRVAEFLGGRNRLNRLACKLYMSHFDFSGQKLDAAIRTLTSELYFRAETQELDRIIEAFSERYFECNPAAVYGSPSVIHQVVYGLLLLNTDLHVADHDRRMTRPQFVDNVMSSIRTEIESSQTAADKPQPSSSKPPETTTPKTSAGELASDDAASGKRDSDVFYEASSTAAADSSASLNGSLAGPSTAGRRESFSLARASQDVVSLSPNPPALPPSLVHNPSSQGTASSRPGSSLSSAMVITPNGSFLANLRKDSIAGSFSTRTWYSDMESTLKDLYSSVKTQQILQPLDGAGSASEDRRPSMTLSPSSQTSVSRARSLRTTSSTSTVNKRSSIRGFGAFGSSLASIGQSTAPSSFGGRLSPTPTYATSMHEGFDQDTTAQVAPGFASNLKHTAIKETDGESVTSSVSSSTVDDLLDEELALLGAPWAKEGMLSRKIYLDPDGKRAKDKVWRNLFAVVGDGNMQMYTFENTSSSTNKSTVGGGNWLSNAHLVDEFPLAHCVAKVLPPPGYNRARPHVFTLDQPNGAQSFFQVGTDSLADEWTSTCNYRAARVSKEPLTGGVSNMEYGWGRHTLAEAEGASVMSARRRMFSATPSIMEWKPPQQPLYPSQLDEETQLEHLRKYAIKLGAEMEEHVSVEKYLVPVRQANGLRAHENYRRKLKFLHEEQFKYQTYIAALEDGLRLRTTKRGEIRLNKTLEKVGRRSVSRDD